MSSPTSTGITGVAESPVSKPRDLKPAAMKRVFSHSRSRRSGSRSMISSALSTEATEAGGAAAEKISERARCLM